MSPTPSDIKRALDFWKKSSQENLRIAKAMLNSKRYNFTMFMCHQALEAVLKALFISLKKERPPSIHKLPRLLHFIGIEPPPEIDKTILKADAHYIKARYFEDRFNRRIYNRNNARSLLEKTEEALEWLLKRLS